jgi:agmatine deiminase
VVRFGRRSPRLPGQNCTPVCSQRFDSDLNLEGGAIEVNGRGVLLVSEPLLMQRNRGRSKAELDAALRRLPGIERTIWLGAGVADDPQMRATITGDYVGFGTGGHTDEFVRFADPRTILLAWVDEADADLHPVNRITRERMRVNFEILSKSRDVNGRPFRIVKVPMPRPVEREVELLSSASGPLDWWAAVFPASERRQVRDRVRHVAAASYLNYLVVNRAVLIPTYVAHGTPAAVEARVAALFRAAFPGRELTFIDALRLNWEGGGIHCATCQQPAT